MIFKTFDSNINKWTSKIGIFGKSFHDLGIVVNEAFKSIIDNLDNFDENVGFWESLKNNLFSKKDNNKNWIKNSLGDIISKENIDSYIKELDLESAKEKLADIFDWENLVKNGETTWGEYFETLKDGTEKYIPDLIKNTDDLSKLTGEDLVKANQQARASALAHNEAIKAQTFSAKAGKVALQALATAGNMIAMWGITEVISGLYELSQVSETVANNAKELGESFESTSSDITSYKSQIEELYSTINDSSSSIEDVANARKSLLSIQDELIDKFGTEKSVINDVTDAINGQTDALDRLTNSKWQETKNEFNDGGFWNDVSNSLGGYSNNIDRMVTEYGDYKARIRLNDFIDFESVDQLDEFKELLEKSFDAEITFDISDGNSEIATLSGNASDVYEKLLDIQNLANQFHFNDSFENSLTKLANSAQEVSNQYKEFYDQFILYEKILTEDSNYTDVFKDITDAYEEYKNAFTSGDESQIKEATENYAKILTNATSTAIANSDSDVASYFESMYPELQSVVEGWKFNIAFDSNADDLQGKVQTVLDELKDENGRSLATEEILGLDVENEQYQALISIAHDYNMTLEEMIELLKERNLVSVMDYQGLAGLFGQENVDKLSPEDLEIAYTIKNVGNMTFEQLQSEIQEIKDSTDEITISTFEDAWADSFTSENDTVKELANNLLDLAEKGRLTKEAFNAADSTAGDYFKNLDISADEAVSKINKMVDESKQLSSMSDQISSMVDALSTKLEDGFVSADTLSGFDVEVRGLESWDHFQEVLGSTTSSYEECQEAANALATEWVNSSDFLAQLTEQNEEYYKTQLKSMGIENYEEVISYAHALNEAKEVLSQSSLELGNATYDEIEALIAEGQYSELTANMILALYDAKIAEQAATIDTSADCANLIALAGDADRTSQSIQLLIQLMNIYNGLESGVYDNNAVARGGALATATAIKAQLEALANGGNEKLEINPSIKLGNRGKSSAKSAGKDAGKSLKDGLKEELSDLNSVISGITGRIDDQINVIKSQKEAALEAIDAQIDALNEQKSVLEAQKKALEEAKEAAIDALEEERDAAVEALEDERDARIEIIELQQEQLEQQIKLIEQQIKDKEKVIKSINDEIKAMTDANEQRKRAIDLQKAQYELERLQHQRTILVYSEEKGMHYVADTKGIRDQKQSVDDAKLEIEIAKKEKQIDLIEKEVDLLNEKKDAINEQIDLLDEELERINKYYDAEIEKVEEFYDAEIKKVEEYYDAQIKGVDEQIEAIDKQIEALEKQREQTERYYESLIENLENSKSKYQELTELVEKAELSAKLKQLGIDEEALVNGSEEEFQKLKNAYLDVVFRLNEGNDEVLNALRELSGYDGTAPAVLEESNGKIDEMNSKLSESGQDIENVNTSLGGTAARTSEAAANVNELTTNLSGISAIVTEEQAAFDALKLKIDEVIEAINLKIQAVKAGQEAVNIAASREMADFLLLRDKILEVQETLDSIGNNLAAIDVTPVNNLADAFQALYKQVSLVATTLGAGTGSGMEGQGQAQSGEGGDEGAGTVNSITAAIQALNEISLEDGIIAQFIDLKTAVDDVTAAINGGGGDGEGSGGEGSGSKGSGSGGNSSESGDGGGSSLTGAVTEMGETANEVIGEPGAEGDGTVIGEFGSMKTAVNDVTTAIGSGGSEGGGSPGGEGEGGDLISSINDLGETTQEELGESGGDGIIGRFEEFRDVVEEAEGHVKGISEGLDEIDGKEVECTIKVNIEVSGGVPAFAEGSVFGSMDLDSGEYNAKYGGKAHYEGTAKATGDWGVRDAGKALVGELGQEIVVRGSRFFTVGDNGAEFVDLQKGDIVFNHLQTKELLSKGNLVSRGKALADGTASAQGSAYAKGNSGTSNHEIILEDGTKLYPVKPGDRAYALQKAFEPLLKRIDKNIEYLTGNPMAKYDHQMDELAKHVTNNVNNVTNNRNIQQPVIYGGINITCPGITSQEVARQVGVELNNMFNGMHLEAEQRSRMR